MVKKHYSCLIASLLLILSGCSTDGLKPAEEPLASPENSEFVSGTAVLLVSEDAADGFENTPRTKAFDAIGIERITAPPACTAGIASPMIRPSPRPRQATT